jgi:hypothetical protein
MSYIFSFLKSQEYRQCENNIAKSINHRGYFRLLNNDPTNPCNNTKLSAEDINEIFKKYEAVGYKLNVTSDTIYESNGNITVVSVGSIIYR